MKRIFLYAPGMEKARGETKRWKAIWKIIQPICIATAYFRLATGNLSHVKSHVVAATRLYSRSDKVLVARKKLHQDRLQVAATRHPCRSDWVKFNVRQGIGRNTKAPCLEIRMIFFPRQPWIFLRPDTGRRSEMVLSLRPGGKKIATKNLSQAEII